jgi:bifunctional non-homologous end joining protein LigD
MQLCCPVSGLETSDVVSGYAKRIAEELERGHPKLVTAKMAKKLRPGKVFIDWSQNNAAKTTVTPYSLRAQPTPTASTPLTWDEVEEGAVRQFSSDDVLERIEEYGDLLAPLLEKGPKVPT